MNIDIERLKHDREYWDSVAPEGSTHYGPETDFLASSWYMKTADSSQCWDESLLDWRSVYGYRSDIIPRPAKQWSGDGLPPVGVECEYRPDPKLDEWQRCIFIGVIGTEAFVLTGDDVVDRMKASVPGRFRPLKSEKDRVVEATILKMGWEIDGTRAALEAAYDAGALKMPEGE